VRKDIVAAERVYQRILDTKTGMMVQQCWSGLGRGQKTILMHFSDWRIDKMFRLV
jgi:hypothetical protein